jgi:hypothetical protein
MTRRSKLWLAVASLFTFINVGGAGFAVAGGEDLNAAAHVGLAVLGAYFVWRLASRARQDLPGEQRADDRLEHLQQSVDAIALAVERIGEAQRFSAKLAAERAEVFRRSRFP